jgi:PTS system fructose-specific IIA component
MVEFVKPERVFLDCPALTADEALHYIAEKAVEAGVGTDATAIYTALRAREDMGATGMTDGYAIPHCMCPEVEETSVVVLKFANAPEWKTMDGNPVVYAISLLVSSLEGAAVHPELLSTIARVLTHPNFRTEMENATTAEEIAEAINKRLHD